MSSPLHTYAGLLERSKNLVHAYVRDQAEVVGYQFWGADTVDNAYGDPLDSGVGGTGRAALFTVNRGARFRSPTLRRKRLGLIEEVRRGTTHLLYDVEDYIGAGVPLEPDTGWMFLRAQENRNGIGLLQNLGIPETTVTLAAVGAGDELVIKGLIFQFQAGANNIAGRTGVPADEFIIGLGAGDNDAAANLTAALNDAADVGAQLDLAAPAGYHTFATNPGAPSAVVVIQPEDGTPALVPGSVAAFTITTADAPRIALDAASVAAGTLVAVANANDPVLGPVYCVPPAAFFGTREPSFSLQGTAPSSTASVAGAPPDLSEDLTLAGPRALFLVFPKQLKELAVRNLSAVNLLVSFGPYQMMRNIPAGDFLTLMDGTTKFVCLACPDGVAGAAFSLHGVVAGESV